MPERTCVGCRAKRPVDAMVRICLARNGRLSVSKASDGRGAWVCQGSSCFRTAMAKGGFERAFRAKLPPDAQKQLSSISEALGF